MPAWLDDPSSGHHVGLPNCALPGVLGEGQVAGPFVNPEITAVNDRIGISGHP